MDSEQVIAAARRSLSLPDKLQVSWDDIRHAIINGLVVGGTSSPPPEVTGLLSGFLRRLPLRRLVHSPRAGPLHGDSALVILWKKEVGIVAVLLTLNARSAICIGPEQVWLALSSIGTNNQCYCWPHGYLLTETPSPSSLKKELHVIGNKFNFGLRKGNTVLIHYRRSDLYQSVLVMQDADLKPSKVSPEQHKYWRYVAPVRSYFDWLPEKIATTFCSTALEAFPGRRYGELEHLEPSVRNHVLPKHLPYWRHQVWPGAGSLFF